MPMAADRATAQHCRNAPRMTEAFIDFMVYPQEPFWYWPEVEMDFRAPAIATTRLPMLHPPREIPPPKWQYRLVTRLRTSTFATVAIRDILFQAPPADYKVRIFR